ncbi:MAG: hypothetical protein PVG87_01670 [Desulfobacteraceae bacterium]|jgi:hypothetical protein
MLTHEEERYILTQAYVPEHVVGLMKYLSGGEPFLIGKFFCCQKNDWVILVGYPLEKDFNPADFEGVVENVKNQFRPKNISIIAPKILPSLLKTCTENESDAYYTLDTANFILRSVVRRNLKKARQKLWVERASGMQADHEKLMHEFVERVKPAARVKNLFFKMPGFVSHSDSAWVLNAWDDQKNLTAFYVVDLAARDFSNYIIGCYSKQNYVTGASDLLLYELIQLSKAHQKNYIHLGLGVNDGIRRFKEKWGARPTQQYEMCEIAFEKPSIWDAIRAIGEF